MVLNKIRKMDKTYLLFVVLRFVLTCLPQTGYVHPDEYFQSIEVVAEKSFGAYINKPWEFNVTFPIRSVALPYFTVGTSFQILKFIDMLMSQYFNITIITSYFIVLFPRLFMCCLSFLVDWSLYKICATNNEKYNSRRLVLSTSYVMLVYGTRPFSNTIELVLFSLLLYFVSDSIIFTTTTVRQREYIYKRYKEAETPVERAKFHKLKLYLEDDTLRNCLIISTISVAGFFNRPTFVAYAVAPIFLWLYRGIGFKSVASLHFHFRIIVFLMCMIPSILFFIIIDSFYFGYLTWAEIGVFKVSLDNFVVTPLNFIKYNINPKNLAQHGLHPRYLHAVVNIPLLFNILAVLGYYNVVDLCSKLIQTKYHYLPTVRSIKGLMTAAFIVPSAMLSIFPHQEPRFLIPLMLPLVYLYGAKILPESFDTVTKSFVTKSRPNIHKKVVKSYLLFKVWIVINTLLMVFYGFLHQGGIFPFISHLNKEMQRSNYNVQYEVVTSHIYTIPESLFNQKRYERPYVKYMQFKRLNLYEQGSQKLENALRKIEALLELCLGKSESTECKLYLVMPTSLTDELYYLLYKLDSNLTWKDTVTFYPHLSTEALPLIPHLNIDSFNDFLANPVSNIIKFFKQFGLARIEFKFNETGNYF